MNDCFVNVLVAYVHSGAQYAQSLKELSEALGPETPLGNVMKRFYEIEAQLETFMQQLENELNAQLLTPAEKFVETEIAAAREAYRAWERARNEYEAAESKVKSVKSAKEIEPGKLLQAQCSYHHARVKETTRFTVAFDRHSSVLWMRDFDFLDHVVSYFEHQHRILLSQYQLLYDMEELFTKQSELTVQRRQQFREHKEHKAKVRKEREEEAYNNRYQPLVDMLCAEDLALITALCVVAASEQDTMLENIIRILEGFQQTLSVLRVGITNEVQRANSATTLFRGNSTTTKLVTAFMRLLGRNYLIKLFAPLIEDVLRHYDSLEIDPTKIPNNDQRQANLTNFKKTIQRFVDAILSSLDTIPMCVSRPFIHDEILRSSSFFFFFFVVVVVVVVVHFLSLSTKSISLFFLLCCCYRCVCVGGCVGGWVRVMNVFCIIH
jgi:hypothetical protein